MKKVSENSNAEKQKKINKSKKGRVLLEKPIKEEENDVLKQNNEILLLLRRHNESDYPEEEEVEESEDPEEPKPQVPEHPREPRDLSDLTRRTRELELRYKKVKNDYDCLLIDDLAPLFDNFNITIFNYQTKIKKLKEKNTYLINRLINLRNCVDNLYFQETNKNVIKKKLSPARGKLSESEEEQMKNLQKESIRKLLINFGKEIEEKNTILENYKNSDKAIEKLRKALKKKQTKIDKLKKKIAELSKVKLNHSQCEKKTGSLFQLLTTTKREYEDEVTLSGRLRKEKSRRNLSSFQQSSVSMTGFNAGNPNKSASTEDIKKYFIKLSKEPKMIQFSDTKNQVLFNSAEKMLLGEFIPNEMLKKYESKFDSLELEKAELGNKVKQQINIRAVANNKIKNVLDDFIVKIRQSRIKNSISESQIKINQRVIKEKEKEVKELEKTLREMIEKHKKLLEENDSFKERIHVINRRRTSSKGVQTTNR